MGEDCHNAMDKLPQAVKEKTPHRGARFLWACGQYWTRTSDLYHVKVAL